MFMCAPFVFLFSLVASFVSLGPFFKYIPTLTSMRSRWCLSGYHCWFAKGHAGLATISVQIRNFHAVSNLLQYPGTNAMTASC